MTDLRENIAKRLEVICNTCAPTRRLAVSLHKSIRPAIVVNDGAESVEQNKGGRAPMIVKLLPQLILIVQDGDNPGKAINKLRAAVLKAVLTDTTLNAMLHPHGMIKYTGLENGVDQGETVEAHMALNFEVTYPLAPADL